MHVRANEGWVINNDIGEYEKILALRKQKKREQDLQNEMNCLRGELDEIKCLLRSVIEGK